MAREKRKTQTFCYELEFERRDDGRKESYALYVLEGNGWKINIERHGKRWIADASIESPYGYWMLPFVGSGRTGSGAVRWLIKHSEELRLAMIPDGWAFFPDGSPTLEYSR